MVESKDLVKREKPGRELTRQVQTVSPAVDIYENQDEIVLHAEMPGVARDDISVNIDNGTLKLSGLRKLATSGATSWEEFGDIEYRRTFSVPQTIDIDKVNAELKDGVLRLHLPKSEAAKPRQIAIKAG
jgi:HSP20 family molecular chaperone IbpA